MKVINKFVSFLVAQSTATPTVSVFDNPAIYSKIVKSKEAKFKTEIPTSNSSTGNRKIFVVRHGERADLVFGSFVPYCFDPQGNYIQKDLNMPATLPARNNLNDWTFDSPLTNVGLLQARLIGESLKKSQEVIRVAICSPMYRCVQTLDSILSGLGLREDVKICIDPALFEYTALYPDGLPVFFTPEELKNVGINVDTTYKPSLTTEELKSRSNENFNEFYDRNAAVTEHVLREYISGNILIVAHGTNLDTNTRLLQGKPKLTTAQMSAIQQTVAFCALLCIEEVEKNDWKIVTTPLSQITHAPNARFDWRNFH